MTESERGEVIAEIERYLFLIGWTRCEIGKKKKELENYSNHHLQRFLKRAKTIYHINGIKR